MELKTLVKRLALRVGRFPPVRDRLRSFGNLHSLLQRQAIFEQLGIDLVLDVGANKGQFAKEPRNFYEGEILSFEPVGSVFEELAKVSSSDSRWTAIQLALGSEEAVRSINVTQDTEFSSFLGANSYAVRRFGKGSTKACEETVSVRRLDAVLAELAPEFESRRCFLKLDTQGYDLQVLAGLGERLGSLAALQCEVSVMPIYEGMPHWIECIALLERAGFGVVSFTPVNMDRLRVVEFDCLMVKA